MNNPARQYLRAHRRRRARQSLTDSVDREWQPHHQQVFLAAAEFADDDGDLARLGLLATPDDAAVEVAEHLAGQAEKLKLDDDTCDELRSLLAGESPGSKLRRTLARAVRRSPETQRVVVRLLQRKFTESVPAVPKIAAAIGELFGLGATQVRVMLALYMAESVDEFSGLYRSANERTKINTLARYGGISEDELIRESGPGSKLEQLGLISPAPRDEMADISLSRPVTFALRSGTLTDLKSGVFAPSEETRYAVTDFPLTEAEVQTCRSALLANRSILIAGEPGIGKTQFAHALASQMRLTPRVLATSGPADHHPMRSRHSSDQSRTTAVRMASHLLNAEREMLIIDEADAILQSATSLLSILGLNSGSYDKAALNDLIESLHVPAIWITNHFHAIPDSAMRRFGHVLQFPKPTMQTRTRMLNEYFADDGEEPAWAGRIAASYDLTPAATERVATIVKSELAAGQLDTARVEQRVRDYLDDAAHGPLSRDITRLPTASPTFDPRYSSPSEPLQRIMRLAQAKASANTAAKFLFAGPPGGGKTQFALYLATALKRDVLLKRPSDLLSKYLGDSEKNIAATFRQAERAGSVLVLDEADALLFDRGTAVRSWEHSQIAEFLQQIQEFNGVLIACTNRLDAVDPAVRRRFHRTVEFGPLAADTLPSALAHIFPDCVFAPTHITQLAAGPPLMMSDLATAAEMLAFDATDASTNPEAIVAEVVGNARARDRTRTLGFR